MSLGEYVEFFGAECTGHIHRYPRRRTRIINRGRGSTQYPQRAAREHWVEFDEHPIYLWHSQRLHEHQAVGVGVQQYGAVRPVDAKDMVHVPSSPTKNRRPEASYEAMLSPRISTRAPLARLRSKPIVPVTADSSPEKVARPSITFMPGIYTLPFSSASKYRPVL